MWGSVSESGQAEETEFNAAQPPTPWLRQTPTERKEYQNEYINKNNKTESEVSSPRPQARLWLYMLCVRSSPLPGEGHGRQAPPRKAFVFRACVEETVSMFSHEHGLDQRVETLVICFPEPNDKWSRMENLCAISMSLFSGTKRIMVYLLIVNARLRRAHKYKQKKLRGATKKLAE